MTPPSFSYSGLRRRAALRALVVSASALCVVLSCRVRRDVPEGPSAEPVVKPASELVDRVERFAVRDAGKDVELVLDAGEPPEGSFALVFGGTDSDPQRVAVERQAAQVALAALASEKSPLDAAVDAVAVMEDSPDRNAGRGSSLRVDGETVQMDAAVMTEDGRFGAIAAISRVRNPVRVARVVYDTSLRVLSGAGAQQFARSRGFADFDPVTPQARAAYRTFFAAELAKDAGARTLLPEGWQHWVDASALLPEAGEKAPAGGVDAGADVSSTAVEGGAPVDASADAVKSAPPTLGAPKVPAPKPPAIPKAPAPKSPAAPTQPTAPKPAPSATPPAGGFDTVAALVRTPEGGFAGAVSSGGPPLALPGRVGDVPTPGAALWVGKRGAVAITGPGERIIDLGLARAVYEKLVTLRSPKLAASWGIKQLPGDVAVSIAVLGAKSFAVEPSDAMAWVGSTGEKTNESATEEAP